MAELAAPVMSGTPAKIPSGTDAGRSGSFVTSGPGVTRVGSAFSIPAILAELGVSPQRAFAQAGVDPRVYEDPENRISFVNLGNLLETCVTLTGCDHFGLLVGGRFELSNFGPLGDLLRHSATVGQALRSLVLHLHLHDRGAAPLLLSPDPSFVILGYSIYRHGIPAAGQILDGGIAIAYRILAELCGPAWKPLRVQLSHAQPASTQAYRQLFRSSVCFDAEVSGVVFAASWLDTPIQGADATRHAALVKAFRQAQALVPMTFADQVERLLPQMVLSGMASAPEVASLFAIHERTLRRRLESEGKNLQQLIKQARFELAQHLLANTALSVADIAVALRYDDPNVFSRAFRNWANLSPTQWRARQ